MKVHELEQMASAADLFFDKGLPASKIEVQSLEDFFNHSLPEDYKSFLHIYGSVCVGAEEVFGISRLPHLSAISEASSILEHFPSSFGNWLIPLRADGMGNYDCIDLKTSSKSRSSIVEWLHDDGGYVGRRLSFGLHDWLDELLTHAAA